MSLRASVRVHREGFQLDAQVEVGDGEVVVLLGPNGAGKTTLLRVLAGLEPIEQGTVELAGHLLEDPSQGVRWDTAERAVGMVFQDHLLFPHLTAVENVAFGLRARGMTSRTARRRAAEVLARLRLVDGIHRRPARLSGGQAQRVALARALASDPAWLLLDEPLAALDVETRHQVRAELQCHLAGFPGPVLLVTHDPVDAISLGDRLVVLEDGRVVQNDLPAEVMRHPRSAWIAELVRAGRLHDENDAGNQASEPDISSN